MLRAVWALAVGINVIWLWAFFFVFDQRAFFFAFNQYPEMTFDRFAPLFVQAKTVNNVIIPFALAEVLVVAGWLLTQTFWWRRRFTQSDAVATLSWTQKCKIIAIMMGTHMLFLISLVCYLMDAFFVFWGDDVSIFCDGRPYNLPVLVFLRFVYLPSVAILGTVLAMDAVRIQTRTPDRRVLALQFLFASLTSAFCTDIIMCLSTQHYIVVSIVAAYAFFAIVHVPLCIDLCRRRLRDDNEEWRQFLDTLDARATRRAAWACREFSQVRPR